MKNPACRSTSLPKVCSLIVFVTGIVLGTGETQRAEARLGGRNQAPNIDAATAAAQGSSTPYGGGAGTGEIFRKFREDRDAIAKTGKPFKIEGHCQSACTLFLNLKTVCIDPNAELMFHAGGSAHSTQVMLNAYNSRLRSYLMTNHYMDTPQFHTISGREMIQKFGYRQCPGT